MQTSLSSLEECRRDVMGRKGVKGSLLVGHEKGPGGFGLRTGDPGDTADGAGNRGGPASRSWITGKSQRLAEPQTSMFFLRYGTPDRAKEGRKDCVCLWVF